MLIDAHQGKVWAESEGRDKGAKFCFSLSSKESPAKYWQAKTKLAKKKGK